MHFFISYAKKDTRALALALEKALEAPPELTAWVDKELKATGSIWSRQIEREIQRCDYMIVLLSEDVNRSEDHPSGESFVLKEVEYMIQLKKERRIIVVMAQETLVPLMLTGKQYIDYRGGTDANALADRLCDELGIARARDLRAAKAAQQVQATAHEREAQAQRDEEGRAERERTELTQRDNTDAEARRRAVRLSGSQRRLLRRTIVIGVGLVAMSAFVAWVLPQIMGNGGGVMPTPTTSATASLGVTPTFSSTPTLTVTATRDASLPPNAFVRQTSNAAWTPLGRDFEGVTMVLVPMGCFMMGSDGGNADEQPVHEQCFDEPFWIDQTEVTQSDFTRLGGQKANSNRFEGADRPVERITWLEARDFCALRGVRLPTEREWEYAARGPDGLTYPWGDSWNEDNAVWSGNSNNQTANVGSRMSGASWVGALDMSGNVWEWTSSVYDDYPYFPDDGREQDSDDGEVIRAWRDGSWGDTNTSELRAAFRNWNSASDYLNFGVRCARDA